MTIDPDSFTAEKADLHAWRSIMAEDATDRTVAAAHLRSLNAAATVRQTLALERIADALAAKRPKRELADLTSDEIMSAVSYGSTSGLVEELTRLMALSEPEEVDARAWGPTT